jgi:hypothetical protein
MEMPSDGRLTILPPRPSLSRRLLALVNALWFGGAARLNRVLGGLARRARAAKIAQARWEPELQLPAATYVPELRMSELLVSLRKEPSLCLVGASAPAGAPALRRTLVG